MGSKKVRVGWMVGCGWSRLRSAQLEAVGWVWAGLDSARGGACLHDFEEGVDVVVLDGVSTGRDDLVLWLAHYKRQRNRSTDLETEKPRCKTKRSLISQYNKE